MPWLLLEVSTHSVEQLISAVQDAQRVVIVLVAFISTGVVAIIAAWQRIKTQIRSVEAKVNPVNRQLTEPVDGISESTIKEKINIIHGELKVAKTQRDHIAEILQRHDEVLQERSRALEENTQAKKQLDQHVRDLMTSLTDRRQDVRNLQRRNIEKIEGIEGLITGNAQKLDTVIDGIEQLTEGQTEVQEDIREVKNVVFVFLPKASRDRDTNKERES